MDSSIIDKIMRDMGISEKIIGNPVARDFVEKKLIFLLHIFKKEYQTKESFMKEKQEFKEKVSAGVRILYPREYFLQEFISSLDEQGYKDLINSLTKGYPVILLLRGNQTSIKTKRDEVFIKETKPNYNRESVIRDKDGKTFVGQRTIGTVTENGVKNKRIEIRMVLLDERKNTIQGQRVLYEHGDSVPYLTEIYNTKTGKYEKVQLVDKKGRVLKAKLHESDGTSGIQIFKGLSEIKKVITTLNTIYFENENIATETFLDVDVDGSDNNDKKGMEGIGHE